jgi:hypothetical protein
MAYINTRIIYSIIFYVLLIILIIISRPSILFDNKGNLKAFGVDTVGDGSKTMFSFGVFTVVLALISFYIFCIIDMIFSRKKIFYTNNGVV